MGKKIVARAPEASINRFVKVFRKLLVSTYVGILKTASKEDLRITPLREEDIISPERVRLDSQIRLDSGSMVIASYDMRLYEGSWRIFNIQIVLESGGKINIGRLISRQFSTIFKQASGDLERAIDMMEASLNISTQKR